MKPLLTTALIALLTLASPSLAAVPHSPTIAAEADAPGHGGGCRKDSPRGQCCHAGSKPYHCH